jgi:5-formaminoimidazole-4-carboxamide-1-beta-D-ribofuranosyl 5'-monophosphate synthetase
MDLDIITAEINSFKGKHFDDSSLILKRANEIAVMINGLIKESKKEKDYLAVYNLSKLAEETYSSALKMESDDDEKEHIQEYVLGWKRYAEKAKLGCNER